MLYACHFPDLYTLHQNSRVVADERFNLSQFYTETTQFHLRVDTPEVLYVSVFVVSDEVARVVDLHFPVAHRDVREFLFRQVLALPVSSSHLYACHAQFASHALWQQVSIGVDNIGSQVVQWTSDRYVFILFSRFDVVEGGVDAELCRSVGVDESALTLWCCGHLLATHHEVVYGQVWILLQQHLTELCGVATTGDSVLEYEVVQQGEVLAGVLRYGI